MAFAQWLPRSNRSQGNYTTQNFTIPSGIDTVRLQLDIAPNVFSSPTLFVLLTIEISSDNGQTWKPQFTVNWKGGTEPQGPGGPIGWRASVGGIGQYAGMLARVRFDSTGGFRWGILGEIVAG